jgi:hypothetical protein
MRSRKAEADKAVPVFVGEGKYRDMPPSFERLDNPHMLSTTSL